MKQAMNTFRAALLALSLLPLAAPAQLLEEVTAKPAMEIGEVREDSLAGHKFLVGKAQIHNYPFEARAGEAVTATLLRAEPGIVQVGIYDRQGNLLRNNVGALASTPASTVSVNVPAPGQYVARVQIMSLTIEQGAKYMLGLSSERAPLVLPSAMVLPEMPALKDGTLQAALRATAGNGTATYVFDGKPRQQVSFRVSSAEFPPVVSIYRASNGQEVAFASDLTVAGSNVTLPARDVYLLVVAPGRSGAEGQYQLEFRQAP
jgi:hypothetical protein